MYVWTGLIFDKNSENNIRNICREINSNYGLSELSFSLPQHVSLKTSFDTENYIEVIKNIKEILNNQNKINIEICGITKVDNSVIWLDVVENAELRKIHNLLNNMLEKKFNIPPKGFDGEHFHFHSTLFQDKNICEEHEILVSKLNERFHFPFEIKTNEIGFGISKIGTVGTFEKIDSLILN